MFNEKNQPINGTMDRYAQAVAECCRRLRANDNDSKSLNYVHLRL